MINCKIIPINASFQNNIYKIKYIPFSISTIKLLARNLENEEVDILIKPINFQKNDDFCGGFDDENTGLKIIWGGGLEEGVSTKIKAKEMKYLFFFVYTSKELLSNYNLTLKIIKSIQNVRKPGVIEEILIKLDPIEHIHDLNSIVHTKIQSFSNKRKITFNGNLLCSYSPRWYPEFQQVSPNVKTYYINESHISDFSLETLVKSEQIDKDKVTLYFKERKIADIEGDMKGASFQTDLYWFNNFIIIRIWFLWISKRHFQDGRVLTPLRDWKEKGLFDFNPELPDIERFDIIVSPQDGRILAICTDFHWQELWYKMKNNLPMKGIIAKFVHPIGESLSRLLNRELVSNRYENILKELRKISLESSKVVKQEMIYSTGEEIERMMQINKNMTVKKGTNIFRSHVPYVRNADILSNMISAIVDKY